MEIVDDLQRESQLRLNTEAQVDLAAAARLCSDLARMKDAAELPALLGRAAELLDASGIVLWMAGDDGSVLRPAASHGYSDHTLAKMKALSVLRGERGVGGVPRAAGRRSCAARRTGTARSSCPINTIGGCAGAMAAEIRHGAEASPTVQAVVTIIAAQLASLVAETTTT